MSDPRVVCEECDGHGGWTDIDGCYRQCRQCGGEGWVDADKPSWDDEEDD